MVGNNGDTVGDIIARTFVGKPTSAKPVVVDGVEFCCWHTGVMRYEWRDASGELRVHRNYHRSTYTAAVGSRTIGRLYRTLAGAMEAAVRASKPLPN